MKILFYGAQQAGEIVLKKLVSLGHEVIVVPDKKDEHVGPVAKELGLEMLEHDSLNSKEFLEKARALKPDLLVSCHGREIIGKELLDIPSKGAINMHPCKYKYPGARPIKRMLEGGEKRASVAVHCMTEEVDKGETICELFLDVEGAGTEEEVYKLLYPLYKDAIEKALDELNSQQKD